MSRSIVVFGTGKIGEVVSSYLDADPSVSIAAFTTDGEYATTDTFANRPLVAFEDLAERFPPDDHEMIIALGYQSMNDLRAARADAAHAAGYRLTTYVHPSVDLTPEVTIGPGSFITAGALIQPRVSIGANVYIFGGALVGHHSTVGDNCWLTSHASILGLCTVGANCFLAANATIVNGCTVGDRAFIGANALVAKDLDAGSVVVSGASDVLRVNSDQFLRMSRFR
jgi:sugar O-acyltransferase (sialic acid O-acetyltransferase NeuD family)